MTRPTHVGIALTAALLACGAPPGSDPPQAATPAPRRPPTTADVTFVEVTGSSGIDFVHNTGAFGDKWLPETMGSGVVLFDADGDLRLDILFVNGNRFEGHEGRESTQIFYHNEGDLHFTEASAETGLDVAAYCLAGAAADLDNDGDQDLYLSCLGTDHLLINDGGRFVDRSQAAGLATDYEFGAGVAILDADKDGWLDIFATRYVTWTPQDDLYCSLDGSTKSYCTPESYPGASPRFYRNRGDGTFEDQTAGAGTQQPAAKSLGVAVLDIDQDGWLDLAVANDTQPNLLYRNLGDGNYEEIGVLSGMAFSETGVARGGMGLDAADYDRSGRQSLVIGNFANEMVALYRNEGNQLFVDVAPTSELGRDTLLSLSFGAFFFDFDLDGWLDILVANGHLEGAVEAVQTKVRYRQPTQLFANQRDGTFARVAAEVAGSLAEPRVARGAAHGDLDGDGDPDVILTTNGGPAALFENRGGDANWLQVDLQGTTSNRDGLGAVITIETASGSRSWLTRTGSSYFSQSQVAPIFGLGAEETVDKLTVVWPSGAVSLETDLAANQRLRVVEPN